MSDPPESPGLTWFQFFLVPTGSFFHRFTRRTQALQISPDLVSLKLQKQFVFFNLGCNSTHTHKKNNNNNKTIKMQQVLTKEAVFRCASPTQSSSWSPSHIVCCLWNGSWRTWPGRCSSLPNSGTFWAYESQTSAYTHRYFNINSSSSLCILYRLQCCTART